MGPTWDSTVMSFGSSVVHLFSTTLLLVGENCVLRWSIRYRVESVPEKEFEVPFMELLLQSPKTTQSAMKDSIMLPTTIPLPSPSSSTMAPSDGSRLIGLSDLTSH